jgi:signal transduction histidine kinase
MHGGRGDPHEPCAAYDEERVEMVGRADSGEGIPPEDLLGTIFEPHFSTRTSGTGLGLAIVRRLVESWGAEIVADSESGRGTRFSIRLLTVRSDAEV